MNKKQTEQRAEELLAPIAAENGVSVYDVEYVREGGEAYLRCYIRKEGGVTIEDCVAVNHAMSTALDEEDFIAEAYTLEVSSPGLTRPLTKDRHLSQEIGSLVDVKLYRPLEGKKVFHGLLKAFDRDTVTLAVEAEAKDRAFARSEIAGIRLAPEL